MHLLDPLLTFITQHPALAYGAVFLTSLSESLALVGLLVPGTVIMFGIGAIVATGSLDLLPVMILAAAGAVAGDGISYWLGRHYQDRLKQIWPFSRYPAILEKGDVFFHRHGGKSVLFGRFVGPVRPVIPVVAGMLGMGALQFSLVNVFSAIGWALAYVLPGVFFGTSLAVAGGISARLAVLIFILLAVLWGFVAITRRLVTFITSRGPAWLAALKSWSTSDARTMVAARPAKRFFAYLFIGQKGEEWFFTFLVLILFAAGWGFLGVLQDVLAKDPLVSADKAVYHFFQSLRTPWADHFFVGITELGDAVVNIILTAAVLIVLLVKKCYRSAGFWLLTAVGGLIGVQVLKWAVHLPRPVAIYHGASAFGFPSGHTTMSVVLYGFLAILLARGLAGTWRWTIFVTVLLISFVIAISRLYLGAHWLSDVVGGFFVGTSWAALMGIAYHKKADVNLPRRLLGTVLILVLLIGGSWHIGRRHQRDLAFYAPRHHTLKMTMDAWRSDGWKDLAAWRMDLAGEREQPLTLQWAGTTDELVHYLSGKGWQKPPVINLKNLLAMLAPDTPIEKLPVLPHLHNGRVDRPRLVRQVQAKRWVLRLWPADATIEKNGPPVYIGTIDVQSRRKLTGLITAARHTGEYSSPLVALQQELDGPFRTRLVQRQNPKTNAGRTDDRFHWKGEVLLLWEADKPSPG